MKVGDEVTLKAGAVSSSGFTITKAQVNRTIDEIKGESIRLKRDLDIWFWKKDVLIENESQTDSIVESVISQYRERSEVGIKKYNNTMDRKDLSNLDWLTHLQQELMDATLYIEKLKNELK